ncbi:hypothetical protein SmJEL517_g01772 [Synchytrium microbalum]|uniref:AAA+ ATPase domain-containing protein n=1 Tax=Synchytrium microbalum TaxID=1806994 RepID=A0A507C4W3_9FUNG|nr:uncharacterized protein SmJEL517_g01772 [Synchytrium microbalum]TPX36027.1 hypothetical protein SmJEL517_g01772 [Synchytrium microbalum]
MKLSRSIARCRFQIAHVNHVIIRNASSSSKPKPSSDDPVDSSSSSKPTSDKEIPTSDRSTEKPTNPDPVDVLSLDLVAKHGVDGLNSLKPEEIVKEVSKLGADLKPGADDTMVFSNPSITRRTARVKSGSFSERVVPVPLSVVVSNEVPIMRSLLSRIQHPKAPDGVNMSLLKNNNVHNIKKVPSLQSFPHPLHASTLSELRAIIRTLVEPPFALARGKDAPSREKIPSQSSGIVVLSSPFRGSEKYLQAIIESLAAELHASYLSITTMDLFERMSGYEVLANPPIKQPSSDSGGWPRAAEGGRRRGPKFGLGNIGVVSIGLNGSGGMVMNNGQENDNADQKETDSPFLPYPYYKPYTIHGKPMSLITSRVSSTTVDKPEQITLIQAAFDIFFAGLVDKLVPTTRPLIIYYEDLMQLLKSPSLNLQDTLSAIQQAIGKARSSRLPVVLIAPSTPTFNKRGGKSQAGGSIESALMASLSGRHDDDTHVDPADEDSSSGGSENPLEGMMGGSKKPQRAVKFDTPLDEWIGVSTVNVYPPLDKTGMKTFLDKMKADCKVIYRDYNAKEIDIVAHAADVDFGNATTADSFLRSNPSIAGILEERPLSIPEIEKIVFMASSHQETPSTKALETSISIFNHSQTALATLAGGVEFSGLFANPRDRLRLNQHEEKLLAACYLPPSASGTSFSNIGGLAKTKQTIDELIRLPLRRPDLFKTGILKSSTSGVLLFGPPGTGKTLLAKAVAHESGANFLSVSMSSLSSMWVGENEKNVKSLFSLARKMRPSVIFVDEIDALLRARARNQPSYVTSTINEFMLEWDGLNSENNGVIVVGATNRPMDLDEAVLRRLPRRILVNLPDVNERVEILNVLLRDEVVEDSSKSRGEIIKEVADRTKDFSGSDLKNLCIAAALNALREQILPHTADTDLSRVLHLHHFVKPLEGGEIVASISDKAELSKSLEEWNKVYGTATGYLRGPGGWGYR